MWLHPHEFTRVDGKRYDTENARAVAMFLMRLAQQKQPDVAPDAAMCPALPVPALGARRNSEHLPRGRCQFF
jgi:hypothetical protein